MNANNLQMSFAPLLNHQVEYFREIDLPVTLANKRSATIIVEDLTLQFHSEKGETNYYRKYEIAEEIGPHGQIGTTITVRPDLQFLPTTNYVRLMVRYREVHSGVPGFQKHEKSDPTYIIVNPCHRDLGQVFISFKQPEDRRLARLLERLVERAGFTAYLKMNDPIPGKDLWDTIEPQLISSVAVAFIWTDHSPWGNGVEREAIFSRQNGKYSIPLIENGQSVPDFLRNADVEYMFFDPEDPLRTFAQAIGSLRESVVKGPHCQNI